MGDNVRMTFSNDVPVGQPLPGVSFGTAVKRYFKGYVVFSGRASRSEFWWAQLFTFIITLIPLVFMFIAMFGMLGAMVAAAASEDEAAMIASATAGTGGMFLSALLVLVVSLPLILPTYAVMWRRLQDANFHGALSLLSLAGFSIVPMIMCIMPSSPEGIRYDPAYRAQYAAQYAQGQAAYGQQPYAQPGYGQQPYGQPAAGQQSGPYSGGYPQG